MQNKNPNIMLALIASIPFVIVSSNLVLIPIYPVMKSVLRLSSMQMNMILTVFSVTEASVLLLVGFLSDRFGRIRILIPSLVLFGLGGMISGVAVYTVGSQSYPFILAGRIVQGMAAAGTIPVAIALIGDLFVDSEEGRALGVLESSSAMAKVLSPILGALLAYISWYFAFFVTPILCFTLAVFLFCTFKYENKTAETTLVYDYLKNLRKTLTKESKVLLPLFFIGTLCICVLHGVPYYLTFVLEDQYKITGVTKAILLAIPLLGMVSASYRTGLKLKEDPTFMQKGMVIGLFILLCSQITLAFFEELYLCIFLFCVSCLGIGTLLPCVGAYILKISQPSERGMILALYGCFRCLGVAAGIPLFNAFIKGSHEGLFITIAGISLVVLTYVMVGGVVRKEPALLNAEIIDDDILND